MSTHYDIIIIGTGPGGGTLAYKLAPSGKKILLLERGGYLPREKDNWSSRTVFIDNKYKAKETWKDKNGGTFHPGIHYNVGGNSKVYGGRRAPAHAGARFRRSAASRRHFPGMADRLRPTLEPYYTQAEHLYHVHGTRGEDPTKPKASAPYTYPALTHEPQFQELHEGWQRCGYKPCHLPVGVMLDEEHKEGAPISAAVCVMASPVCYMRKPTCRHSATCQDDVASRSAGPPRKDNLDADRVVPLH